MSVLIKGLKMPETEYVDVRIFRDGTDTLATGTKPYYRELKAEPVWHGKWIETDEWDEFSGRLYKCSNCKTFVIGDIDNYCPYCGAYMKGTEDD